ncbi:MAG: alpha/beta hydrolase-fold protein [Candidatus Acidiferrales bacterium]|jgi:predicted alpha/beta superfamily hydrolase
MRILFVTVLALLVAGCSSPIQNSGTPSRAHEQASPPAFLPDTKSWVVTSSTSGRTYQISVALPDGYTKEHSAYPVLYAANANAEFGTVVETARWLSFSKEIPDLVIVGIAYPNPGQGFKASFAARLPDLTPTADPAVVKEFAKDSAAPGVPLPEASGGAAEFLSFIRNELAPSIEQTSNVSHEDRAWFGHSAGGLFGVYALFNSDGLFKRFVIGSPSLWWSNRAILSTEESFAASGKPLPAIVFFSVGTLEQGLNPRYSMVTNLRAFTDRLKRRNYKAWSLRHISLATKLAVP